MRQKLQAPHSLTRNEFIARQFLLLSAIALSIFSFFSDAGQNSSETPAEYSVFDGAPKSENHAVLDISAALLGRVDCNKELRDSDNSHAVVARLYTSTPFLILVSVNILSSFNLFSSIEPISNPPRAPPFI